MYQTNKITREIKIIYLKDYVSYISWKNELEAEKLEAYK